MLDSSVPARRCYAELLGQVTGALVRRRVVLCVQVRLAGRAARQAKAAGGGLEGGCVVLLREAATLAQAMRDADLQVNGPLSAESVCQMVRDLWAVRPADPRGSVWPTPALGGWAALRTGATWHATSWIAEWPRVDVGPEFLAPLVVTSERRTLSVVMEPIDPTRAMKLVQRARMADVADAELRRRGGFLGSARRSRE
jgi:hypothetical protein